MRKVFIVALLLLPLLARPLFAQEDVATDPATALSAAHDVLGCYAYLELIDNCHGLAQKAPGAKPLSEDKARAEQARLEKSQSIKMSLLTLGERLLAGAVGDTSSSATVQEQAQTIVTDARDTMYSQAHCKIDILKDERSFCASVYNNPAGYLRQKYAARPPAQP